MKNIIQVPLFLLALTPLNSSADTLESLGWDKNVDDFEGTTNYSTDAGNYDFGCAGGFLTAVLGLVQGDPKEEPLTILVQIMGLDERLGNVEMKARTPSGIIDLPGTCASEYNDGSYTVQCLIMPINNSLASTLQAVDYYRFGGSRNVDMRIGGDCENVVQNIQKLSTDYLSAQE